MRRKLLSSPVNCFIETPPLPRAGRDDSGEGTPTALAARTGRFVPLMVWVRRVVQAVVVATVAVVPVACAPIYTASCQNKLVTSSAGPITDPALTEISGIHVGVANPGIWWVHNDSDDTQRVFALDATVAVRGTYSLTGATAID